LGIDDFDRFLNSKFLTDKISQMLLSDQVKTLIANGRFDIVDFVLPSSATTTVGTTERLTNDEIYALFNGLKMLGITNAEFAFEMSTLTSMTTDEVNTLLASTYLYVVLDLMIKSEESLTLPDSIYEIGGDYAGMVKKSEITDIFLALSILGVSDLSTTPDPNTITLGQLSDLLDQTDSGIVQYLISQAIITALGSDVIPIEAFDGLEINGLLTDGEIVALVDALTILAGGDVDKPITDIDTTNVTVGQVADLADSTSFIIMQIISDAIIDAIGAANIPDEAYGLSAGSSGSHIMKMGSSTIKPLASSSPRLSDAELDAMIDALLILAGGDENTLITNISTTVNVGQASELKTTASYTIKQLISDAVVDVLPSDDVPDDAFIDNDPLKRLKDSEISAMIDALVILANGNLLLPVTDISTDVTVRQVTELDTSETGSVIIKQLITNAMVDVIDPLDEGKIPTDAYDLVYTDRLSNTEIDAMINALVILANGNLDGLVTAISTDVNVGQVKQFKGTGSYIIKQLVSDAIIDAIGLANIPDDAFISLIDTSRLSDAEIDAMIDALDIFAEDNILVINVNTDVTIGQTQQLNTGVGGSAIIKKLISDAIIDMIDPLDEGKIPLAAYHTTYTDRLSDDEIGNMLDVLEFLGEDDTKVSLISTDINIGQLKDISTSPSLIMKKLISDSIVDAVGADNVPLDAYIGQNATNNITQAEIDAMIVALEVLAGSVVPGDKDLEKVSGISTDVTIGQTQDLDTTATGSSIIKQMISDSIITMIGASDIPLAAYHLVYTDRLSDDEIGNMLDVLGFLGEDDTKVSLISTDINIGQLKDISTSPSLIMKKLISDSIIDAVGADNVPLDAHIGGNAANNLTQAEIDAMIEALDILAGSLVPGDKDLEKVSGISTNVTIGQTQDLDTTATGSSIIKQMISDSIITMIGASDIPTDAYHLVYTDRLSDDEIGYMLDVLGYLGNDEDPVSDINVDITIGQLKQIKDSSSLIMKKLISDSVIDAVGLANVPDDAYIDQDTAKNLTQTEINAMVSALEVFAGSTVPGDKDLVLVSSIATTNVTVGQTQDLKTNASVIIKFMISDAVITMFGAANIPDEAYHLVYTDRLSDAEIAAMIDALGVLGAPTDSVTTLGTDVTVGQTQDLDTTATGSVIIKQMISDAIVEMLTASRIPDSAHIDSNPLKRLTDSEIGYMQQSLLPLAGNDEDVLVSDITVTESTLSVTTLQAFPEESIILNRMISTALIDGIDNIPDESYTELVVKKDIKRPEIDNILDALVILNIGTGGAGSITTAQITFTKLDQVAALGSADPVNYPDGYSPLILHILSEPMIASVTDIRGGFNYGVPTTAYRNTYDLKYDELLSMIAGLKVIGNVPANDPATTTLADAVLGLDPSAFGPTMLENLIAVDSLVIYRMISIGINDSGIDTVPSHTIIGDVNHDAGLPGVPAIYDIKIAEMNHIVLSMEKLGITNIALVASQITVGKLKLLTPEDRELLIEAVSDGPNTIIYYLISETVDSDNTLFPDDNPLTYNVLFDSNYVMNGGVRVRLLRASITAALALL
jgi:hypothetical protein